MLSTNQWFHNDKTFKSTVAKNQNNKKKQNKKKKTKKKKKKTKKKNKTKKKTTTTETSVYQMKILFRVGVVSIAILFICYKYTQYIRHTTLS